MDAARTRQLAIALFMAAACWEVLPISPHAWSQPPAEPSGLRWESNLEAAQHQAAESGRLVLVHFGAPWCAPCRRMEQVFSQPGFGRELAEHFVAVKLNRDHHPATARRLGVDAIPADVVLAPDGRVLHRMQGARTADRYIAALLAVADDHNRQTEAFVQTPPQDATPPSDQLAASRPTPPRASRRTGTAWDSPPDTAAQQQMPQAPDSPADAPPARRQAAQAERDRQPTQQPSQRHSVIRQEDLPPDSPPLALDGYCPVTLCLNKRWAIGDVRYGAVHRGRTYLFAGPQEQQEFLTNPDRYSPVLKGNDPVLALDEHRLVPGERRYGLFCAGRIYLFSSEKTLQTFARNPQRYLAEAVQAQR